MALKFWNRKVSWALAVAAVAAAVLLTQRPWVTEGEAEQALPSRHASQIELSDCYLGTPGGFRRQSARCGSLFVPEDPSEPEGRSIELAIAVVPALSKDPAPDPLVYIAGGPGQSSLEAFVGVASAFERIRMERDILLVDQRGTGSSNRMDCPMTEEDADRPMAELVEECLAVLPGDPRYYTTSVAVTDLDRVREALGYPALNLYGVSYGTRVALHHMRRYPDRTRSVMLDGVVPADLALGPEISINAEAALAAAFDRCAEDPACAEAFPELPLAWRLLNERLERKPETVSVRDPLTALPREVDLTQTTLAQSVRMMSYMPETVSLLPLLIGHADQTGDLAPLAAQALMVQRQMSDMFAIGMHNAVVCTEDVPFYDRGQVDPRALEDTYLGAMQYDALLDICERWPQGVIDDGFKTPVESDIPVLLLSGEVDPITPPANGDRAAETLSNSVHLVASGQGHAIVSRGCMPRIVTEFVETADPAAPDVSCMDTIRPQPFFLRFTGPQP